MWSLISGISVTFSRRRQERRIKPMSEKATRPRKGARAQSAEMLALKLLYLWEGLGGKGKCVHLSRSGLSLKSPPKA